MLTWPGSIRHSLSLLVEIPLLVEIWNSTASLEDSWPSFTKLNIVLTCDLAIMLLVIHPNELKTFVHTTTCTRRFLAVLFIFVRNGIKIAVPESVVFLGRLEESTTNWMAENNGIYSLTVQQARSLKSRCGEGWQGQRFPTSPPPRPRDSG